MSAFDDMFDSKFFWDDEYRQRRDIENLKLQVDYAVDYGPQLRAQAVRIDQLELLCKALTELLVAKGIASSAELGVLMQQIDLTDGVEDGRMSGSVRASSPRCGHCQRFVNPQRQACVYCGTPMAQAAPGAPTKPVRPDVTCAKCGTTVPESDSYFTSGGLVCDACFDPGA